MAQYNVTAFRWSGTGYNAQYNTSYSAVIDDDDPYLNGPGDNNETVSINGGPSYVTGGSPYDIDVSFTDTSGNSHVETFYFFYVNNSWYFIPGPALPFPSVPRLAVIKATPPRRRSTAPLSASCAGP